MAELADYVRYYTDESTPTHGTYQGALFDPRWKSRRKTILDRDKNKCVICSSSESLRVHHRQYHFSESMNRFKNPWEYEDSLMVTLCEKCHQKGHQQYKVPVKKIK